MEAKYPTLSRPKRKLCYLTDKENTANQWAGKLSLEDVDRMFDDLDSVSQSLLLEDSDLEKNQGDGEASPVLEKEHMTEKILKCRMVPTEVALHPATRSPSPKLHTDMDIPFNGHWPVKTSSPIEGNMVVEGVQEENNEKDKAPSPILFACEEEKQEEARTEPLPIQEPMCTEKSIDLGLESPPGKVVLSKPMSSQKTIVVASCSKDSAQVGEKNLEKPQTPVSELPSTKSSYQGPAHPSPEKHSEGFNREPALEMPTHVGKDMTSFLQKLREAVQPKPANFRMSLSPIKVPTPPPDPEDDFLILEDDAPLLFSIPSRTTKKQNRSKTSSSDRDSSTDKGTKDSQLETAQKQLETDQGRSNRQSQTVHNQKRKKNRRETDDEVAGTGNDKGHDILLTPEDLPAVEVMEQDKPKKKKKGLKRISSTESDTAENERKETGSRETDELKSPKAQVRSEVKRPKSLKNGTENAKTSRTKLSKVNRKGKQGSDGVEEKVSEDVTEQGRKLSSEEHTNVEDLGSLSDKDVWKSEANLAKGSTNGKIKQSVFSEESLSEDTQVSGKRKRNPPGQWWLSNPQSAEETEVADKQQTLKKSKQNQKELHAAASSPGKVKRDEVLKIRNRSQVKKKKIKPIKDKTTNKVKATLEDVNRNVAQEQQQEVLDQDLDPVQSSPSVFSQHSLNSENQLFPRAYHHSGNKKMSSTPVSLRGSSEQRKDTNQGRRRRKPPGDWWRVDNVTEDVESIAQTQQLHAKTSKAPKERKKKSKQKHQSPNSGNKAVSSQPVGGAPASLLDQRPPLLPKSVKSSLATFKDLFTSTIASPAVIEVIPTDDYVQITAMDLTTPSKTNKDTVSVDAWESNQESPPDMLTDLRSGPSSMVVLEQFEDMNLPSSRMVHAGLSVLDMCAPPLKPLIIQEKDRANLTEWLKCLWPTPENNGAEISPDQFDWYFYQGRAIGVLEDLHCGSICTGKILLGSYMKKPLWVDHSATAVFNVLTSSVGVNIDCTETQFNPGQSFMVPCGHAYSFQNLTAQPAVLYFTRVLAEGPD